MNEYVISPNVFQKREKMKFKFQYCFKRSNAELFCLCYERIKFQQRTRNSKASMRIIQLAMTPDEREVDTAPFLLII